jgi:hypothetical protein
MALIGVLWLLDKLSANRTAQGRGSLRIGTKVEMRKS